MKFGDRFVAWVMNQRHIQDLWTRAKDLPNTFWDKVKDWLKAGGLVLVAMPYPNLKSAGILFLQLSGTEVTPAMLGEGWPSWIDPTDPSKSIALFIREVASNETFREPLEVLGTVLWDSVAGAIEYTGEATPDKAREASRRLIGIVTALTGAPQVLSAVTEVASVGQIDKLGDMMQNIYWNLGLGFLTWQTLGDVFGAYISEPLAREYDYQTRPRRISVSQAITAYQMGLISRAEVGQRLAGSGLPDKDLNILLDLSANSLSRSDLFSLMEHDLMTEGEVLERLTQGGYTLADAHLLLQDFYADLDREYRETPKTTLKTAYLEGLLSEGEYRSGLAELGYSPQAVDLEVELARMKAEEDYRKLGTTQVKQAYIKGVIGKAEAITKLVDLGYVQEGVNTLLKTWDLQAAPVETQLTQSMVSKAYLLGILDYSAALRKLQDLGYSFANSKTILEVADSQVTEIERKPTAATLQQAYKAGLLDDSQFLAAMAELGYSPEDSGLYLALANYQGERGVKTLSKTDILKGLKDGVLGPAEALVRLVDLGYGLDDAQVLVVMNMPAVEGE